MRMLIWSFSNEIRRFVLEHFVSLNDLSRLFGRPGEDQREVGQQTDPSYVLQGTVGLLQVDLGQEDPQFVHLSQLLDPRVDVVRIQVVVLQGEEEDTRFNADDVIRDNLTEFPRDVRDALQDRISPLLGMHQNAVVFVYPSRFRR